ncbi:hypothetical protein FISHEDRAFT_73669 [Fistulina hepatica ATCC 64428]|uniref:Uncharacterized protein n=1 Tax=Fistulina hepatica ATCC 64428 TaxID=1128425 RepID=A0A0D7ACA3_9AGAR|nr:hypothetical protein FISHEDRAFT_73669 [Fistulina hepatica ATCC 64428]
MQSATPSTRRKSDAVREQWYRLATSYDARYQPLFIQLTQVDEEMARLEDEMLVSKDAKAHLAELQQRKDGIIAEINNVVTSTRIEWHERLTRLGLRAEDWQMSPQEEKMVENVLSLKRESRRPRALRPSPVHPNIPIPEPQAWSHAYDVRNGPEQARRQIVDPRTLYRSPSSSFASDTEDKDNSHKNSVTS